MRAHRDPLPHRLGHHRDTGTGDPSQPDPNPREGGMEEGAREGGKGTVPKGAPRGIAHALRGGW